MKRVIGVGRHASGGSGGSPLSSLLLRRNTGRKSSATCIQSAYNRRPDGPLVRRLTTLPPSFAATAFLPSTALTAAKFPGINLHLNRRSTLHTARGTRFLFVFLFIIFINYLLFILGSLNEVAQALSKKATDLETKAANAAAEGNLVRTRHDTTRHATHTC